MKNLVEMVGGAVVAAALMAIPVLAGLSFGFDWGGFRYPLSILTIGEWFALWVFIELSTEN